ncbi:TMEM175 family protein [Dietzia alimentaria]|uniref:TMEM175 family protein n=1 Tax=Dietzia alimentaria TaxID=665550 RepID=UPI000299D3C3|nr:TMEM175 family protein [Dietzia alimentaria]
MTTSRLEAFSDGVLAIIITVMVLELSRPQGNTLSALLHETGPGLLAYLLSFIYVAIYWNNHHHTLQLTDRIDGSVLWANLAWLFFLSLLPFSTGWMAQTQFSRVPVILYGVNLLFTALAFFSVQWRIIRAQGEHSRLRQALGRDWKGKVSGGLYSAGVISAVVDRSTMHIGVIVALAAFVVVALLWFIPDRRIDRTYRISQEEQP